MVTEKGYVKQFFELVGLDQTSLNSYFLEPINYANTEESLISNVVENLTPKEYIYTINTQRILSLGKDLMLMQINIPEGIIEVIGFDEQNAYFSKNRGIIYNQGIKTGSNSETTLQNMVGSFNAKTFGERMHVGVINKDQTYKVRPCPEKISNKCEEWIKRK